MAADDELAVGVLAADQDRDGMGRMAVQAIIAMSTGKPPTSRHVELATSLTVRGSTSTAPALGPGQRSAP